MTEQKQSQTAEEYLNSRNFLPLSTQECMHYAQLYHSEQIASAGSELPDDEALKQWRECYDFAGRDNHEAIKAAQRMRTQASVIIAGLKADVEHNALRAIEIAKERDEKDARIKELEEMTQWVSVKDGLPKPISMVLIATNFSSEPWMAYYVNDWYILSLEGNGPIGEFKSNLEITHWRYLPLHPIKLSTLPL